MKLAFILAATFAASAAVAAPSGEAVFKQRCAVCHSIAPAPGKMGPPLAGVAGLGRAQAVFRQPGCRVP